MQAAAAAHAVQRFAHKVKAGTALELEIRFQLGEDVYKRQEVYLEDGDADARVEQIHATMADYAQNVLTRAVDGFVYVERTEQSGRVRQGCTLIPCFLTMFFTSVYDIQDSL